ncbi:hypothetical protein NXX09_06105 [Bacteroides uniformis]|nr:hypothetical protein [Bacteroides uniformis]
MEQEHQLKSLLTEQQFEDAENKEFMLAQARACANGYALATEGIAVVSDFQNNECHIYSGRFGQTIMDFRNIWLTIHLPLKIPFSATRMKKSLFNVIYSNFVSSTL